MSKRTVQRSFEDALLALVEQIKRDRSILAAILCGSLSHDTVWEKSDIDLVLVTIDDPKVPSSGLALDSNGVNVHVCLMPRTKFRQTVEGSIRQSFIHSLLAKGKLLYTHDPSIDGLFARLAESGERDLQLQLLETATSALPAIYKAHKWFVTRRDLEYTALWILYAANPLAKIEVIGRGLLADREVLPQALQLNPAFFKTVYIDLLNSRKSAKNVQAALDAVDAYVAERATSLFGLVIEYLDEIREARSSCEIDSHFERNHGIGGVTTACEYLADQGLIGKAALPTRLTKKSNTDVQELAFFSLGRVPDEFTSL